MRHRSESKFFHLRQHVIASLSGVLQRSAYGRISLCQSPDNALTRRKDVRLFREDRVGECLFGVYQLPAFRFEHRNQIIEEKAIQQIVVDENRVLDGPTQESILGGTG